MFDTNCAIRVSHQKIMKCIGEEFCSQKSRTNILMQSLKAIPNLSHPMGLASTSLHCTEGPWSCKDKAGVPMGPSVLLLPAVSR